jgi:hypothetical protein
MSRELRRVPPYWQHPKRSTRQGERYVSLYDSIDIPSHREASETGERGDFNANDYMPDWPSSERTHFQMYETTSEGTPISPIFADVETLCRWLADTNASAFANQGASYEQWLAMCRGSGRTVSAFVQADGTMQPGFLDKPK